MGKDEGINKTRSPVWTVVEVGAIYYVILSTFTYI